MSQDVKGTFTSAGSVGVGALSADLLIPSGCVVMYLSLAGTIDASNTAKTQKSTDQGASWSDVTTYNSAQSLTPVTVATGERWRFALVTQQASKDMRYALSAQSA